MFWCVFDFLLVSLFVSGRPNATATARVEEAQGDDRQQQGGGGLLSSVRTRLYGSSGGSVERGGQAAAGAGDEMGGIKRRVFLGYDINEQVWSGLV